MGKRTTAKVTISLPQNLLALVDRMAREQANTRSGVIAALLEKEEESCILSLMAEGYGEWGKEDLTEAEEALTLTNEVVLRDG